MKHIMICGAGGYLGTVMTEVLLASGYKITAVDRFYFGETLEDLHDKNLRIIKADIRKMTPVMFKGVDIVINLASLSNDPASELMPKVTKAINYKGAVKLAQQAKSHGVSQYIFASSCSVYGAREDQVVDESSPLAPVSEYAKSKIMAEKKLLPLASKKFSVTILRLATLYGLSKKRMRFDLMINIMALHAYKKNKIFIMGGGKQWRPLLHVKDCIRAFTLVIEEKDMKKKNNAIYNVGSNEQVFQVFQVANLYKKFFPQLQIEYAPDDPDLRSYNVDFTKFRTDFSFSPEMNVEDGIEEILASLDKGEITDGIKTNTLAYYKYLLEADKILAAVKLRNNLF